MLTRQRKQLILEKLGAEGQVQSKALSILFDVSEDTIRRDLRELFLRVADISLLQ